MKKFASLLLTVVLLAAMLTVFALPASAADSVNYIVRDWDGKKVTETTKSVSTATEITSTTTTLEPGWYVASGTVTVSGAITVNGTTAPVNLILADGCKLTVQKGIRLIEGNTLNIYGQSNNSGTIEAKGDDLCAGIGGYYDRSADSATRNRLVSGGNLNIYGGRVNATGGYKGAGIGGSSGADQGGNGCNVTVYGGTVNATGNDVGAGIGGDDWGDGGNVTVYGGTVNAIGSQFSAGIGAGECGNYGNIEIYGGTVNATGNVCILGNVTVRGGTVNTTDFDRGKAGYSLAYGNTGIGGNLAVHGGRVNATAYDQGINGNVTVHGGTVNAKGNVGIGSTHTSDIVTVTIYDGTVTAIGGKGGNVHGAGIGGKAKSCTVEIRGGTVTAQGGNFSAGIGGDMDVNGCNVTIYGGTVTATGGYGNSDYGGIGGAGIGGGGGGNGGNVEIHGGTVTATGIDGGAGIGGGCGGDGGNVKILGGFVTAIGDPKDFSATVIAQGIGCGTNGSSSGELYVEPTAIIMADSKIVESYTGQIYFKSHFHNSETIKCLSDTHHQCVICDVRDHRWSSTDAEHHTCIDCGKTLSHSFKNGKCACGKLENHEHNYKPSTFYVCDCGEKAPEDYVPAGGVGSVLSGGSWWIIGGIAVVAVVGVVTLIIVKKKKKPALAEGENKDEE